MTNSAATDLNDSTLLAAKENLVDAWSALLAGINNAQAMNS